MRRTALILLYTSGTLIIIGGLGDQFINDLLDVHLAFLGDPEPSELLSRSEQLILLMLHTLGGGLISTGVAVLTLTHFAVRKNQNWALWTILAITWIAEGFNTIGMYLAGSYYYYPLSILIMVTAGFLLYRRG